MGAGKTTIGKQLAARTNKQFLDSDHEIELRTGAAIDLIFELEGEEGFRKRESQIMKDLMDMSNIVLATGGGVILSEKNRALLKKQGLVIYLKALPEQLLRRLSKDKKRPLLQTNDRLGKIRKLLIERELLYEETADIIVKTDKSSIKQIIDRIVRSLI